jgi:hypothetical protein
MDPLEHLNIDVEIENFYMTAAADVTALTVTQGIEEKKDLEQHSICSVIINNGYVSIIAGLFSL